MKFAYESVTLDLVLPAGRSYVCTCSADHKVGRAASYTPDFVFADAKLLVEAKGRFEAAHRAKAIAMLEQHPEWQYRLLFEEDNKLSRASKTRYSDWCAKRGIEHGVGLFPEAWLKELKHAKRRR